MTMYTYKGKHGEGREEDKQKGKYRAKVRRTNILQ
jgi:hypothetical protein